MPIKDITVPIADPTTEIPFVFTKTPRAMGGYFIRIVPMEGNFANRLSNGELLITREAKMNLCLMRDALKEVFVANGLDFEKDTPAHYAPLERRLR